MRKLTLDLETLDVQSFAPVDERQQTEGTVFAAASPSNTSPACCYTFGCGDSINQSC